MRRWLLIPLVASLFVLSFVDLKCAGQQMAHHRDNR
jgi:hypothetical protein